MKSTFFTFIFLMFGSISSLAQSFQYTQMDQHQRINNTASPALISQKAQLNVAYRSSWSKISLVRDMLLSYDHRIDKFSVGFGVMQNDAGDASLKSTRFGLQFSYKKQLSSAGDFIAIGLGANLVQQRFLENSFQFDNQYIEGSGFDRSLGSRELFLNTNQMTPVMNVSFLGNKYFNRMNILYGFSINNLKKNSIGFYNENIEVLPREIAMYSRIILPWSERVEGSIYLALRKHKLLNERIIGFHINYKITENNSTHIGISNRLGEAFVLEAGLGFKQSKFSMGYEFNNRMLSEVNGFKGIFELSYNYSFN